MGPARRRLRPEVDAVLVALVDRVTRRMRRAGRTGRTVVLRLRFGDYARVSRSRTLPSATAETRIVLAITRQLLAEAWPVVEARGITLVGVALTSLDGADDDQLALPVEGAAERALDAAIDAVRARFGTSALRRARLLDAGADLAPWTE
jgi:DNA polymerase-4